MIIDELWHGVIAKPEEDPRQLLLCMGCIEDRLGRHLVADDLINCSMNGPLLNFLTRWGNTE
jgi:hypothetical protein